jgi:cytochrome b subunit of formate dehydrogenase
MNRTILLVLGVILFVVGLGVSYGQWGSGIQPWGQLLTDNFLFARSLPFTIGLGIVVGFWRASGWRWGTERRASDGAIRRFAPGTVALHALAGVALVGLIATGGWQYLKGLLDADSPIYMGTVYRIHYIAASLLIFVTAAFVTDWLLRGARDLTMGKGQGIRSMRGLAHELPRPIGSSLAYLLGLDLRRAAPPTEQFTYYERAISFPLWELSIGLIILTGVIKAMRYVYPIPGEVLYWVSAVHVGSGVLLGLKLLDHLRYVLAPSRWPLMASMASGWVPAGYVQRFHPSWYARITSETAPSSVPASPAPGAPSPAIGSAGGGGGS